MSTVSAVLIRVCCICQQLEFSQDSCHVTDAVRLFEVIWSSGEAHTVDALAARGDEGRGSLR
jgi:hypothetical protein